MNRLDYYRPILLGFIVGVVFITGLYVFLGPEENVKPAEALEPKGNFVVVDTYRGCDVVKYTDGSMATYKYFLDCKDK